MADVVKVRASGPRSHRHFVFAAALLFSIAVEARAADRFWIDPTGGGYTSTSNWQDRFIALDGDVAHFGVSTIFNPQANYTVTFGTNISNQLLLVEDDLVTFDLNGHSYETTGNVTTAMIIGNGSNRSGGFTVTDGIVIAPLDRHVAVGNTNPGLLTVTTGGLLIGSPWITVGSGANGTLTINNGGDIIAGNVDIAYFANNVGAATITGPSSSLLSAALDVGRLGSATLDIFNSGRVDSSSAIIADQALSTGAVTVDGTNSLWNNSGDMTVGSQGNGELHITGGGRVFNVHKAAVANSSGSTGAVTVSGANSRWEMSDELRVGESGLGSLTIEAGGTVSNGVAIVNGSVTVTGGSTWNNGSVLNFGFNGSDAALTFESGSHVTDTNSNLAIDNGVAVTAVVRDANTTWTNSQELNVGLSGQADLRIESGAQVTSGGGTIGAVIGSSGTATITGVSSKWTTSADFSVGGQGTGQLDVAAGGTLLQTNGGLIVGDVGSGQLNITASGQATGANSANLGNETGSTGAITVSGTNSRLAITHQFNIGVAGRGSLSIADHATVSNGIALLRGSHSSASVQGAGATWTNSGILNFFDDAQLMIGAGGSVASVDGNIGVNSTADSRATVSGAGSNWFSRALNVGFGGTGTLDINSGGSVSSADSSIAIGSGSTGTVTVAGAGSTWTINGALGVGVNASTGTAGGTGVLRIQSGGTVNVTQRVIVGDSAPGHMNQLFLEGGTLITPDVNFLAAFKPFSGLPARSMSAPTTAISSSPTAASSRPETPPAPPRSSAITARVLPAPRSPSKSAALPPARSSIRSTSRATSSWVAICGWRCWAASSPAPRTRSPSSRRPAASAALS